MYLTTELQNVESESEHQREKRHSKTNRKFNSPHSINTKNNMPEGQQKYGKCKQHNNPARTKRLNRIQKSPPNRNRAHSSQMHK